MKFGLRSGAFAALFLTAIVCFPPAAVLARTSQASQRVHARKKASAQKEKPKQARLDIAKINDPNTRDPVGPHSQGDAVVRAEILLDRLKFSPGEIGDSYNDNLAKAIAAFQSASGLSPVGFVDAKTWAGLNDDQAKGHVEPIKPQAGPQPTNQQPNPPIQPQSQTQQSPSQNPNPSQDQPASQSQPSASQGQPSGAPPTGAQQGSVPPPALITYIISMQDVEGPFTHLPKASGERLMLLEAKLRRLNYESPLDLLAERFHSSPHLLIQLNPGKRFDQQGVQIQVPNVLTPVPRIADKVVVDAATHSVTALDQNGKVLAFYPATVGSEHDPLPVGNWTVKEIKWYPNFKYNPKLFWDAENKSAKATLPPGPKSPVGVIWIGLSKEHYGIHGTPNPALIGRTQSHGCIRLTNWDADELGHMVYVGTTVILEEGTPSEVKPQ